MNDILISNIDNPKYYGVKDLKNMLPIIFDNVEVINTYKKIRYFNIPVCFDIETTSFISEYSEKTAIMYVWTLGINGYCFIGRTWDEFKECLEEISTYLMLTQERLLIIYVHNQSLP